MLNEIPNSVDKDLTKLDIQKKLINLKHKRMNNAVNSTPVRFNASPLEQLQVRPAYMQGYQSDLQRSLSVPGTQNLDGNYSGQSSTSSLGSPTS